MAIQIIIKGDGKEAEEAADRVAHSLKGIGDSAEREQQRVGGFMDVMKTGLLGGGLAVVGGLTLAGKAGLDMNNTMEQVEAKLNAFTKDAEVSKDLLKQISDEAARTPFAFDQMANATASLMSSAKSANVPVMDLVKQAEILAASNPAQGLEGAAFALREATGGDFTSIIERFDLPRQRLKELKEQGVPALEAVSIAMSEMGYDADLVSNMANTMGGRWSTFQDTLVNLAATVTQPIFDTMSQGLADLQAGIDGNMPAIQAFTAELAGGVVAAIEYVTSTVIPALVAGWNSLQPSIASGAGAFTQAQAIIQPVMDQIMDLVETVLPLISQFWAENGESIMAAVTEAWGIVVEIITVTAQIVGEVLAIIGGFIDEHGTEIVAILTTTWNVIRGIVMGALNLVRGIVTTVMQLIKGDFSSAWETIQDTAAEFVTNLVGVISGLGTLLGQAINLAIGTLHDAWDALVRAAPEMGTGIIAGIVAGVNDGVGALVSAVTDAAGAALKAAKEFLGVKSPSTVARSEIGLPFAQGMQLGLADGIPLIRSGGAQLAQAAMIGAQSYGGGGGVEVGGSIDINLRSSAGLEKMIDAQITKSVNVLTRRAAARKLGS